MEEILFIGGDKRILYAAELISQSTQVHSLGLGGSFPPPQGKYPAIVLPLPFSRSGVTVNAPLSDVPVPLDIIAEYAQPGALVLSGGTSPALEELCSANQLKLVDYYAGEELTLKNALLTAEGALSLLISGSERALCDSAAVITGYGWTAAARSRRSLPDLRQAARISSSTRSRRSCLPRGISRKCAPGRYSWSLPPGTLPPKGNGRSPPGWATSAAPGCRGNIPPAPPGKPSRTR